MRYFFISILIILTAYLPAHKMLCNCSTDPLLQELDQLAKSNGMEFVIGSKFPVINPYDSYGSTYVFDFIFEPEKNSVDNSVLFLCRKRDYVREHEGPALDLVHNYRYFLVYATKMKHENKFQIQNIISNAGLKGMSLYYGHLDIDLSKFRQIDNEAIAGPKGVRVNFVNGCVPIVISCESSTQIFGIVKLG
ncbi:hypothetical protein Aasi_0686 [Candidatus Amoebophilus asiaticus 5a2]|uniref:Uncharacterized protein n=1 Tax=Amoebophilus asiaticus (strain 5a2) TaxID=452471 RepID=B3ES75_AMOA5|nr:hypothetical protein [Candidatus Amoebophilus asiaticus]ACE06077.1 hypothetical protein Aasi_0686 [Candidatus Amoebophilus asiaticus 5a2]